MQGLDSNLIVVVVVVVLDAANHATLDDANAILSLVGVAFDGFSEGFAKFHPVNVALYLVVVVLLLCDVAM